MLNEIYFCLFVHWLVEYLDCLKNNKVYMLCVICSEYWYIYCKKGEIGYKKIISLLF